MFLCPKTCSSYKKSPIKLHAQNALYFTIVYEVSHNHRTMTEITEGNMQLRDDEQSSSADICLHINTELQSSKADPRDR